MKGLERSSTYARPFYTFLKGLAYMKRLAHMPRLCLCLPNPSHTFLSPSLWSWSYPTLKSTTPEKRDIIPWIRINVQFSSDQNSKMVLQWCFDVFVGDSYCGILRNLLPNACSCCASMSVRMMGFMSDLLLSSGHWTSCYANAMLMHSKIPLFRNNPSIFLEISAFDVFFDRPRLSWSSRHEIFTSRQRKPLWTLIVLPFAVTFYIL